MHEHGQAAPHIFLEFPWARLPALRDLPSQGDSKGCCGRLYKDVDAERARREVIGPDRGRAASGVPNRDCHNEGDQDKADGKTEHDVVLGQPARRKPRHVSWRLRHSPDLERSNEYSEGGD